MKNMDFKILNPPNQRKNMGNLNPLGRMDIYMKIENSIVYPLKLKNVWTIYLKNHRMDNVHVICISFKSIKI